MTPILIVAQHDGQYWDRSLLATIHAASQIGSTIDVLLAAENTTSMAEEIAAINGIHRVLTAQAPHYQVMLAEQIAPLVAMLANDYTHILTAATTTGKDIAPRIAALLDIQQISDIIKVISPDTFARPIYAGNAIETVQSLEKTKLITIRPSAFDKAGMGEKQADIVAVDAGASSELSSFIELVGGASERPDLAAASVVISGGRGLGSAENFAIIEKLADKLGAAIGASRAAVDAGYISNEYQVGQTGKIVAPDLYIAVGLSGAIQHLAGMKASKVIVAINKDENAPIFAVADYGLVGDLFDIIPELTDKL